ILLRDFTPQQLLMYDGREGRPLYTAVLNRVYDVTRGAQFYGPDGPYGSFAGHDSSRCLAKHSFSADLMVDPKGPIDKLEDLDDEERQALREWAGHFEFKYDHVGTLVENSQ
ncbi:putative sterol-binding protein, partial [Phlyctochytrium arcticum]